MAFTLSSTQEFGVENKAERILKADRWWHKAWILSRPWDPSDLPSLSQCTKHQDIVDAPTELLTALAWRPDREADVHMFLSVPGITSKDQLPGELRNLTLALTADRLPHNVWTHVYADASAEEGINNGGNGVYIRYSGGDIASLAVPGGLQCFNYRAEILTICTAAEHLLESGKQIGNIAIFTDSLSILQVLN